MAGFGKRLDGPGGRRSAPRAAALKAAAIITVEQWRNGYLLDVSATGARLECAHGLKVGQYVAVKVGTVEAMGSIVWCRDDDCGITFDAPLAAADLSQLTSEPDMALFAALTKDEKLGADAWDSGFIR